MSGDEKPKPRPPKSSPPSKGRDVYATREADLNGAVGDAVSRWARLDFVLLQIFATALAIPMLTAASLFHHIKAFSLALDLTDSAVQSKLQGASGTTHWKSLVKYVRELSSERNYIAHTTIVAHGPGSPESGPDWLSTFPRIGPSIIGHLIGKQFRPVDVAEVRELVKDFQHAIEALMKFHQALQAGEASLQKLPERIPRRRSHRK
jgi:hypothetical protein